MAVLPSDDESILSPSDSSWSAESSLTSSSDEQPFDERPFDVAERPFDDAERPFEETPFDDDVAERPGGLLYVVEQDFRHLREDSDVSETELEDALFGLEQTKKSTDAKRRRRKRKTVPYAKALVDRKPRRYRKSAAVPFNLPDEAKVLMEKANDHYIMGESEKAVEVLKEVVKISPGAHDPLHLLGVIYERELQDTPKAVKYYFLAAYFVKTDLALWKHVGELAQASGDLDTAIYCYRRVAPVNRDPAETDEIIAYKIAALYLQRMDFKRAVQYFEKLLYNNPGDAWLTLETAKCYYKSYQYGAAKVVLENAVQYLLPKSQHSLLTSPIVSPKPPRDTPVLDWRVLEQLATLYFEQNEIERCLNVINAILAHHCDGDVSRAPVTIHVRQVAAQIRCRLDNPAVETVCGRILQEVADRDLGVQLHMSLADAYLACEDPYRALEMYKQIEARRTASQNSLFWVKIAKCYFQLKDFKTAASFLESVVPESSGGNIEERVRDVEARLLLLQVLQKLDDSAAESDEINTMTIASALSRDTRLDAFDIGLPSLILTDPLTTNSRHQLLLRLSMNLTKYEEASQRLTCASQVEAYLEEHKIDEIPVPLPPIPDKATTILLPPAFRVLFEARSQKGLTIREMFRALQTEDGTAVCPQCQARGCPETMQRFMRVWRCSWLAEFILLIKDSTFDTKRILNESSRQRAEILARQLLKERDLLPQEDFEELDDDQIASLRVEEKFIVKTRPKAIEMEVQRRRQNQQQGFQGRLLHHASIKEALNMACLEDMLGWGDYYQLIETGCRQLVAEKLGRLAVELIEATLLSVRYSRVQVANQYGIQRTMFRQRMRRLSLRIAVATNLMRLSLASVRLRCLLPCIRRALREGPNSLVMPSRLQFTFHRALTHFAWMLFTNRFAHHAAKSISAGRERDIVAFNRAWCTRHLMEFPNDFHLTMMVGHYCSLSMRWPYAVAEYTRATLLRPQDEVAALCLSAATIGFSTSRGVQDRHQLVLRGFALLERFERLRATQKATRTSSLAEFAKKKLHNIVRYGRTNDLFWSEIIMALRNLGLIEPLSTKTVRDNAARHAMAKLMADFLQVLSNQIEGLLDCELSYNRARAYHNLSLDSLASNYYSDVLQKLDELDKQAAEFPFQVLCELSEMLKNLKSISPPSISIIRYLMSSKFPPACDGKAVWAKDIQLDRSPAEFALALLMLKLPSGSHQHGAEFAEYWCPSGGDWFVPHRLTHIGPSEVDEELRKLHPLAGLFDNFGDTHRVAVDIDRKAKDALKNYVDDVIPSIFLLGLDRQQLRFSAALNLSNILRIKNAHIEARNLQQRCIVW